MKLPSKMRLRAQVLAAGILLLAATGAHGKGKPDSDWEDLPNPPDMLGGVLRRGDTLITYTSSGFYQGSMQQKSWKKMDTPKWMLPQLFRGILCQQGPDSPLLAFFRPYQSRSPVPADFPTLTISKDLGKTWQVVVKGRVFSQFLLDDKGSFFAVESTGKSPPRDEHWYIWNSAIEKSDHDQEKDSAPAPQEPVNRLLWSQDMGATWKDITSNLPADRAITSLLRDPDHPGQVCVTIDYPRPHGLGIKIFQAGDTTYHWQENGDLGHFIHPPPPKFWEENGHGVSGCIGYAYCAQVYPTLSNFFTPPMLKSGGEAFDAFQMEMGKPAYTFRAHGPKIITARLVYFSNWWPWPVKVLDLPDETVFWGIKVVALNGAKDVERGLRICDEIDDEEGLPETRPTRSQQRKIDACMHNPRLVTAKISPGHPYQREIDLSAFCDLSKPGNYKVQLSHDDIPVMLVGADVVGPMIDVTITP